MVLSFQKNYVFALLFYRSVYSPMIVEMHYM